MFLDKITFFAFSMLAPLSPAVTLAFEHQN